MRTGVLDRPPNFSSLTGRAGRACRRSVVLAEAIKDATYDSGRYEDAMDTALALADWDGFSARRAEARERRNNVEAGVGRGRVKTGNRRAEKSE